MPNNLNQYASVNGVRYSYDADGNLLTDGTRILGWDVRNRLIQVTKEGKTIAYNYDHNDLRVEKEVDGNKVRYYYEGSLLLCEKDGAGKVQKVYINDGEGIIGMVRYIYNKNGIFSHHQRLYYLYDSLGSVSVITNELGFPVQQYTYSPYGSTMNVEYDPVNNLRFVGRYGGYKDDDTGLTYFWHRWYDEEDGRWGSRDPLKEISLGKLLCKNRQLFFNSKDLINFYSYVDTVGKLNCKNIYSYTNNRPSFFIDRNGLTPECPQCPSPQWQPMPTITTITAPSLTPRRPSPLFVCDNLNDDIYKDCYKKCMDVAGIICGLGGFTAGVLTGPETGIVGGFIAGGGVDALCLILANSTCKQTCTKATK